ncbi:MAG: diguanylate cyclase [Deltaproteobacteria bacterium]|nr:diguanylate cyclase [Deltaproteobacteria bacterium]
MRMPHHDPVDLRPQPPAPPADLHVQEALDTLADVVRTLGRYALDVADLEPERVQHHCEGWASHVLRVTPPPGLPAGTSSRRDWSGLRRFVSEQRQQEQRLVRQSVGDLRQAVVTFVQALNLSVAEDEESDRALLDDMEGLRARLERGVVAGVQDQVARIVRTLEGLVERRRLRHRQQMAELSQKVMAMGHRLTEAEREKQTDPLTGLFNRRVLDAAMGEALSLLVGFQHPATVLLLDLDHFKAINDQHGHVAGDEVLRAVADALTRTFPRRSDVVCRYGGEEFAVLLSDTPAKDAGAPVARLLDAVRAVRVPRGAGTIKVTVSVGGAEARPSDDPTRWLERADECLYAAKRAGRDRAVHAAT